MTAAPQIKPTPDPASKHRLRLWLRILRTHRMIEADLRARLRVNFDTTLPRFDVMAALYRHQRGLKMTELSRMLMVSNGNVTGIVDRLSQDGLMLRETVTGDKRALLVRLTPKGIEVFLRQAAAHEAWVDELLAGLDAETCSEVGALLKQALTQTSEGAYHD